MFAITGITGQVGAVVAERLLESGLPVRAVVRSAEKGRPWAERGCQVAIAALDDASKLTKAFSGTDGVFLMTPPDYDAAPGFPQTLKILAAVSTALSVSRPAQTVFLSTTGAQVKELNLLSNATIMEGGLRELGLPVAFLRAAWFMENAVWDVDAARAGAIAFFLQSLDHRIPMVATSDIGVAAANLLRETWTGTRVVELEGPKRYAAIDIASGFARALEHEVDMSAVPRDTWETLFRSQGAVNPLPRMRMLEGFNEGWIKFEGHGERRRGATPLEAVLAVLVGRTVLSAASDGHPS